MKEAYRNGYWLSSVGAIARFLFLSLYLYFPNFYENLNSCDSEKKIKTKSD